MHCLRNKKKIRSLKFLRGFTLVELLIVVSIMAILSLVIFWSSIQSTLQKGRDSKRKQDLVKMSKILEDYYNDHQQYPYSDSIKGTISGSPWGSSFSPYVVQLPKDPLSPNSDYYYQTDTGTQHYALYARLEFTGDTVINQVGCQSGCGPKLAYNFVVTSPDTVFAFGQPNWAPVPTGWPTPTIATTPTTGPSPTAGPSPTSGPTATLAPSPTNGPSSTPGPSPTSGVQPTPTPSTPPGGGCLFAQCGFCSRCGGIPNGTDCGYLSRCWFDGNTWSCNFDMSCNQPTNTPIPTPSSTPTPVPPTATPVVVAPVLVQECHGTGTTATPQINCATGGGHLLVAMTALNTGSSNNITSVTDSAGNTWLNSNCGPQFTTGQNSYGDLWYAVNARAVSSVTLHISSAKNSATSIEEFSGINTVSPDDKCSGRDAITILPSSGSTTSTSQAVEMSVGALMCNTTNTVTMNSSGWNPNPAVTGNGLYVVSGYHNLNSITTDSVAGIINNSSAYCGNIVETFKGS